MVTNALRATHTEEQFLQREEEKTYPCTANTGKRLPKNRRANLAIQFKGPELPTSLLPHLNLKPHTSRGFKKETDIAAINAKGIDHPLK